LNKWVKGVEEKTVHLPANPPHSKRGDGLSSIRFIISPPSSRTTSNDSTGSGLRAAGGQGVEQLLATGVAAAPDFDSSLLFLSEPSLLGVFLSRFSAGARVVPRLASALLLVLLSDHPARVLCSSVYFIPQQ
jgi:hypothetical protein